MRIKILALLLVIAIAMFAVGCFKENKSNAKEPEIKDGITRFNFLACTGNVEYPNCFELDVRGHAKLSFMDTEDYDFSLLESESAHKLIDKIEALPETFDDSDPLAYRIEMSYITPDGTTHDVTRAGYGHGSLAFPEDWKEIVDLVNEITMDEAEITYNTTIRSVDSRFLRDYYDITEDMMPEGASLNDLIKKYSLDYETLLGVHSQYKGYNALENLINDFIYDYYELPSLKLHPNNEPKSSTPEELHAYAESMFDSILESDDRCVKGTFQDSVFAIVRFECLKEWSKDNGYDGLNYVNGDEVALQLTIPIADGGEFKEMRLYEVFREPTDKFVIVSTSVNMNYKDIYDMLTK